MSHDSARNYCTDLSPHEGSSGTPWSSGRVLSKAQRDRKRLMNRASQLKRREDLKRSLNSMDRRLRNIEKRCLTSSSCYIKDGRYSAYPVPTTSPIPRILRTEPFPYINSLNLTPSDNINEGTTLCDSLNEILSSVYRINPLHVCADEQTNQDVVIRGVVLGWRVLEKETFICPIWAILNRIDTLVMAHTTVPTRLALLRGVHLMLLSRNCPERLPPLPLWFRPRDCDLSNSPNSVIDYLAWPRLRAKLRTSNHTHLTNRFWFYFAQNVRFEWHLSPAQTIDMDKDSGKYQLTMPFRDATDVIQRYTMGQEFFNAFPDYYGDIPAHNV